MIEWSQNLISDGVNGGRRSVLVGSSVATALAITVAKVIMSISVGEVVFISTKGRIFFAWFVLYCLMDGIVVDISVISSIDEILAEDRREVNSLLLSTRTWNSDSILFSKCNRYSSIASEDRDCIEYLECFEFEVAKLFESDVKRLLFEISDKTTSRSATVDNSLFGFLFWKHRCYPKSLNPNYLFP